MKGVVTTGYVAVLLVALTSCSEPFVAPTTRDECLAAIRDEDKAERAVNPSWGMAYSTEERPLGSTGFVYLCVRPDADATITTEPLSGVEVSPQPLLTRSHEVPTLEVTVTEGEDEQDFRVIYDSESEGGTQWVEIHVDDGEWSFHSWRR
jgi:hypothetical protein